MLAYLRHFHEYKSASQLFIRLASTRPTLLWPLSADTKLSANLHQIEEYWSDKLLTAPVESSNKRNEKKYILSMFPYPSGMLHMGHMRVYSISDVLSRYYKLNGYDVIHPIGWDAFGLPADNAAIERGIDPKEWTYSNAAAMKQQLLRTGVQFDWDKELYTCDPVFYKWTQWIFLKLFEADLVHRTVAEVNWDPVDKTVLAEEQIDGHGCSWRSGAKVEKRKLAQWMIETPKYAKRLSDGLEALRKDWKEVADIQANWIGKCDVWRFVLRLKEGRNQREYERFDLRIKDPTELSNAQFLVVERDHPLVRELSELPKEAAVLGPTVTNFITGKQLPIVVISPEQAEKDSENGVEYFLKARIGRETDEELMKLLKLKPLKSKSTLTATDIVELAANSNCAGYETSRSLNDWVVSRQRTWGTPIPMALTKNGEAFPVTEEFLPVLSEHRGQEFRSVGKIGHIENETLDTFFDSSWYYLRFLDPSNEKEFVDKAKTEKLMPVDIYVGGVEHAAVHMFFARFVSYFLFDQGLVACPEPFKDLVPQGVVRGRTFAEPEKGRYITSSEVEQSGDTFVNAKTGAVVESTFEKMSKSKHNGVDPITVIQNDGVDLARLQLLIAASPRANLDWGVSDLKGLKLWIDRIGWVVNLYISSRRDIEAGGEMQESPPEVEKVYKENFNFFVRNASMLLDVLRVHNTAIARLQGLTNALRKMNPAYAGTSKEYERCVHALVIMLQVFAPNMAAELWSALCKVKAIDSAWNHDENVYKQAWPLIDQDAEIDLMLNTFGISCGREAIDRRKIEDASDEELIEIAQKSLHSTFFEQLKKDNLGLDGFEVTKKRGLHVSIDLKMKPDVTEEQVRDVLDRVSKLRIKQAKEAKNVRRKERKLVAAAR